MRPGLGELNVNGMSDYETVRRILCNRKLTEFRVYELHVQDPVDPKINCFEDAQWSAADGR
jgi:hypothetical protein